MNRANTDIFCNSLKISFLLSIVLASLIIAKFTALIHEPLMASAVTFDLVISLPIFYWFFFRNKKVSKQTIFGLIIFGIVLASFILPDDNREFLRFLTFYALPLLEVVLLSYAIVTGYKLRVKFKSLDTANQDFLEALRQTPIAETPNKTIGSFLCFEIAEFYYAFLRWRTTRNENHFTCHQKNGAAALLGILIFIVLTETFVLHYFVAKYSSVLAWILTVSSVYVVFQIFAHAKACFLRPVEISADKIFVRCGMLGDAEIDLKNIASVEVGNNFDNPEKDEVKLSSVGKLGICNLKIALDEAAVLNGIYGRKKVFKVLSLAIDEPEKLKSEIEKRMITDNE